MKRQLKSYLTQVENEAQIEPFPSIRKAFDSIINPDEVAYAKQKDIFDLITRQIKQSDPTEGRWFRIKVYADNLLCRLKENPARHYVQKQLKYDVFKQKHYTPAQTLILNFNYMSTAKRLYAEKLYEVVNIHGENSAMNVTRSSSVTATSWMMTTNGLKNCRTTIFSKTSNQSVITKRATTDGC